MSKTTEEILTKDLQLKPEHLDATHLISRFMKICRDTRQTPKKFEKSMHDLYDDARKFGF
tara:strand:+ start:187 stop:366 length:180 start_codon:yes stop_codon:yes gene_type:complete